ncbi:Bicarbonate transport ATP-binding protein CmpD [Rosistilla carotiformis]|uniref:Bicarbonate transport ATP-binding protein CmpD n=1 Tax=Rosistilla carotiformis TaxID=2528017 RepID=A0A518JNX3_9BACT|nr:ABC transporter ATP-binding protein [Rosistilla carotiformis]QDV67233.1 Bicarbonate transport ATP-binding protein CmpD [Rosistilla carotiformis]
MIVADSLNLSIDGQSIIETLDLQIAAGEFVAIVGPSGCGKTSLLRMVADLQRPSGGSLKLSVADRDRPPIAYVFQDPTLLPWRTVLENIALPLELAGKSRREATASAAGVLSMVGLRDDDRNKLPAMLSGGMRMRVSLARAVVMQPQIMLFDEPFAALDDLLRSRLNEQILQLWRQQRWTGLFVTHNVSEAIFLSNRVLVMTDRPARIAEIVDVPFDHPREASLRSSIEFNRLTERLTQLLRGEAK